MYIMVMGIGFDTVPWVQFLIILCRSCVTLSELLNYSDSQFLHILILSFFIMWLHGFNKESV